MIHCVNKLIMIKKVFKGLDSHDIVYWTVNEDLHSSQFVKKISEYYLKIRMFRYAQDYTTKVLRINYCYLKVYKYLILKYKRLKYITMFSFKVLSGNMFLNMFFNLWLLK